MSQSKLKSVAPTIINGVHSTFAGQKGILYKFTIEFENGDKGGANSTKPTPSWQVGLEYTYTKTQNGEYINFKDLKKVETTPFVGKGDYVYHLDKPEVVRAHDIQFAIKASLSYATKKMEIYPDSKVPTEEGIIALRTEIIKIINTTTTDVKEHYFVRESIQNAIDNMVLLNIENGNSLLNKSIDLYNDSLTLRFPDKATETIPDETIPY